VYGLESFLRNVISNQSTIDIGKTSLLLLFELQDVDANSDYQDVVIEIFLEKPSSGGICGAQNTDDTDNESSSSSTSSVGDTDPDADPEDEEVEEGQKVICHFPPGNRGSPETIVIGESAWKAHSAHGDRPGECESDGDGDGVLNSYDLCPDTYMPEAVPTTGTLLFHRFALTSSNPIFISGPRKKFLSEFTLESTKGCSCGQMIDVAEGKKTYHFEQYPRLYRNMKSLFPFYTRGARSYGCGRAIMKMVKNFEI
jgi:hypothetical protein